MESHSFWSKTRIVLNLTQVKEVNIALFKFLWGQ